MITTVDPVDIYKIAEIYMHIRLDYYSSRTAKLGSRVKTITSDIFSGLRFSDPLVIDVAIEKGSVKFNIKVYGAILKMCISEYGNINRGLLRIISTLKILSEQVIETAKKEELDIDLFLIRTEKRTALPGHIKRTLDSIADLQGYEKGFIQGGSYNDIALLRQEMADILAILGKSEREALFNSLSIDLRYSLPEPDNTGILHLLNLYTLHSL